MRLRLYVAGDSPRSRQAIANARRLVTRLSTAVLDVVDVIADPEAAEQLRILTTPTLVKDDGSGPVRVTGDLSDMERVLIGLGLDQLPDSSTPPMQ